MIGRRLIARRRGALGIGLAAGAIFAFAGCTNDLPSVENSNLVNGKQLFVQKCGSCHVLARADSKGVSGPNLDDAFAAARLENWGDDGIRGVVYGQILFPNQNAPMPANLVTGKDAADVAAYVGAVAAKPGKDVGLLASAVAKADGGSSPGGKLFVSGDPATGALACGSCHLLKAAGTTGGSGPNLDTALKGQDAAMITSSILDPDALIAAGFAKGVMPSNYATALTKEQIAQIVAYLEKSINGQ